MTPKRPKELKFIGNVFPDGRPEKFLDFVPARDLDPDETDALDQDQLKAIRDSGLYREVAQPEPKKASAKRKAAPKGPVAAPEAVTETETTDVGDDSAETAEPVTESEG